jgi:hypothetical protein
MVTMVTAEYRGNVFFNIFRLFYVFTVKKLLKFRIEWSYRQSSKLCRYPILEKTLFAYIMKKRDIGVTISRKSIQMTARKIGQSMNLSRFTASNGWLENFLIRKKLSLRRITSTGRALPRNTPIIVTDHLRKMAKLAAFIQNQKF